MLPLLSPHFRCIAPDLLGFGRSDKPLDSFDYTRASFAHTLHLLLNHLKLEQVDICGHSMGGSIAIQYAAQHPSRVRKLSLIDSACYPFSIPLKGRLPLMPVIGPFLFKHLYRRPIFRDYFKREVWSDHPNIDERSVDEYYEEFTPPLSREAAYRCLKATISMDSLVPLIPMVRAETAVIWGEEDRIFPLELGQRLSREIPNATLTVLDRCGHAPNEERPQETANVIKKHHMGESSPKLKGQRAANIDHATSESPSA